MSSYLHEIYRDDNVVLYLDKTSHLFMDGAFLHVDIYKWSHNIYKDMKEKWNVVTEYLRNIGYKEVFATAPSPFEEKLFKMFGLEDTGITIGGYRLMRKELCHK